MIDKLALEKAIAELPNGYRTVFVLHDVEGYEHEEISNLLDISIGTSKSQLHKARMRLRQLLNKT
jgi:RNA polymerase sigma-70 factor (ECF subfamily)